MLDRNRRIKIHPQRFQDEYDEEFDIVITAEERVYDQVLEGIINIKICFHVSILGAKIDLKMSSRILVPSNIRPFVLDLFILLAIV